MALPRGLSLEKRPVNGERCFFKKARKKAAQNRPRGTRKRALALRCRQETIKGSRACSKGTGFWGGLWWPR
jgi:hypothetical protein